MESWFLTCEYAWRAFHKLSLWGWDVEMTHSCLDLFWSRPIWNDILSLLWKRSLSNFGHAFTRVTLWENPGNEVVTLTFTSFNVTSAAVDRVYGCMHCALQVCQSKHRWNNELQTKYTQKMEPLGGVKRYSSWNPEWLFPVGLCKENELVNMWSVFWQAHKYFNLK